MELEELQQQNRSLSEDLRTKVETIRKLTELNKTLGEQLANVSTELKLKDDEGSNLKISYNMLQKFVAEICLHHSQLYVSVITFIHFCFLCT